MILQPRVPVLRIVAPILEAAIIRYQNRFTSRGTMALRAC